MAYPSMSGDEKMDLIRLVVYEGMQRAWRSSEKDEAMFFCFKVFFVFFDMFFFWLVFRMFQDILSRETK